MDSLLDLALSLTFFGPGCGAASLWGSVILDAPLSSLISPTNVYTFPDFDFVDCIEPFNLCIMCPLQVLSSCFSTHIICSTEIFPHYCYTFCVCFNCPCRLMLGLAIVPAVIRFLAFFFLPESPRWLVSKGKVGQAAKILKKLRDPDLPLLVEEELIQIKDDLQQSATKNKQSK